MKCTNCGAKLSKKQPFCGNCGALAPTPEPKEPSAKKPFPFKVVVCILLAVSLAGNFVLRAGRLFPQKVEGKGFASPEAAITAYVDALSDGDVDKMLSTFAVETYSENYDLEAYIMWLHTYYYYIGYVSIPNDSQFEQGINRYTRVSELTSQIRSAYFALAGVNVDESYLTFHANTLEEEIEETLDQLTVRNLDDKLSSIKKGDILYADDFDVDGEQLDRIYERYNYMGADEFCDVVMEIKFNGNEYYVFMLTAKYGEKWYNITPLTPLAGYQGLSSLSGGIAEQ